MEIGVGELEDVEDEAGSREFQEDDKKDEILANSTSKFEDDDEYLACIDTSQSNEVEELFLHNTINQSCDDSTKKIDENTSGKPNVVRKR